jgi:hypothetical protein
LVLLLRSIDCSPWHGACFNASSGDIEEAPSLNSLQHFPVFIEGDDLFIEAEDPDFLLDRPPKSCPATTKEAVVIVGAGSAGVSLFLSFHKGCNCGSFAFRRFQWNDHFAFK